MMSRHVVLLLTLLVCSVGCEEAVFSAGCFWKVKDEYTRLDGVRNVTLGYIGGWNTQPVQEDVILGRTGHAEAVKVAFDEDVVGYRYLLKVFWRIHDATLIGGQGMDIGTQFRSALWPLTDAQHDLATLSHNATADEATNPITTSVRLVSPTAFQPANLSDLRFHCVLSPTEDLPTSAHGYPTYKSSST